LDVGEDTSLGDGYSGQQLVQLLVVTDGELEMSGDDSGLLVVSGSRSEPAIPTCRQQVGIEREVCLVSNISCFRQRDE
jgi:hypothetical protein